MKLMEPVAQSLADVRMLDHADDAGDVRVLRRAPKVEIDDVAGLKGSVSDEVERCHRCSHDDAVEVAPLSCWWH